MGVFSVSTEEGCKALASLLLLHRKVAFNHSGLELYFVCIKKKKQTKKTSKRSFVASQEDGRSGKREDFLRLHKASRASEQLIKVAPVPPSYFTTNSRGLRGCTGWLPWMRDKYHPTPEVALSGRGDPTPGGVETWSPQRRYEQGRKRPIWEAASLRDWLHRDPSMLFPPPAAAATGTIARRQSGIRWHKPPLQGEISFKFNSYAFFPLFLDDLQLVHLHTSAPIPTPPPPLKLGHVQASNCKP